MPFNTIGTQAAEAEGMRSKAPARLLFKLRIIGEKKHGEIVIHSAAARADKVGMGRCAGIVTLLSVYVADTYDKTILHEHTEIAVNGAEAQVGYFVFKRGIELLGGGMRLRGAESTVNCVPFPAGTAYSFHKGS